MYHYRPRQSKTGRPITFRVPPSNPMHEAPSQQSPHSPDGQQQATQDAPSLFEAQLCLLLLLWCHEQQQAPLQEDVLLPETPADTIIVDSVMLPPDGEDQQRGAGVQALSQRRTRFVPLALGAGALLCLCVLGVSLLGLVFTASASVTLIPTQTTLSTSETVTIRTAGSTSLQGSPMLAGRLLSTLTLSQARTVPTTGIGQQAAQAAHGQVTFYNAALSPQTIPAGTLLTGTDGVEIVTDQDARLSAAHLPTEGQLSVTAHAVQVGPQGNIAAGDLQGPCCRDNVFVQNRAAFVGGQDARTYPMLTRHDLDSAVATLTTTLGKSVQAAYAAQLTPAEALLTPVGCTPHVSSSQQVGQEARHVSVTLADTCTGIAYEQQALSSILLQRLTTQAHRQLGAGYSLLGDLQIHLRQAGALTTLPHGTLTVQVQAAGVWAYQFSESDLERFSRLIAGKSQQQATALLLHQPGVGEVAISNSTLPADPQRIRLLVLSRPV